MAVFFAIFSGRYQAFRRQSRPPSLFSPDHCLEFDVGTRHYAWHQRRTELTVGMVVNESQAARVSWVNLATWVRFAGLKSANNVPSASIFLGVLWQLVTWSLSLEAMTSSNLIYSTLALFRNCNFIYAARKLRQLLKTQLSHSPSNR